MWQLPESLVAISAARSLIDVAWMQKVQQTALKDHLWIPLLNFIFSTKSLQILSLLEAMDLVQYREVFHREHITGEILVECTEEVLQNELEITSKIHRIRLMKIISGQHSASNFLKTWHLATALKIHVTQAH